MGGRLEKANWDITYACPLRCTHCYSESGRRASRQLSGGDRRRVAEVLASLGPARVSVSGGEPLLLDDLADVGRTLRAAGIEVSLFTGGWGLDRARARELAGAFSRFCVSVDGATDATHDRIRGRPGSFARVLGALEALDRLADERRREGVSPVPFGIETTVVRSNLGELEVLVRDVVGRFPSISLVRIGAALPIGLASRQGFVEAELLDADGLDALVALAPRLAALAPPGVTVVVSDVREYLFGSPWRPDRTRDREAHLEPDGRLRAFPIYEGTVGSVLEEPFERLWDRAVAFREDPFVEQTLAPVRSLADWAAAVRALDLRFGSEDDRRRILARPLYEVLAPARRARA